MRRRDFISWLGAVVLARPLAAAAQSRGRPPLIGILIPEPLPFPAFDAFRQGLRDLGYVEGRTIVLDPRWPAGRQFDDYLAIAKDFVHHNVDVIVAGHTLSSRAAKAATQTIPIVIGAMGSDPIELGLAKSMARPGYNITGMSLQTNELPGKRLELIKDLMPMASRIAVLLTDDDYGRKTARDHEAPARILGLEPLYLEVHGPGDFEAAFEKAKRGQADAVLLTQSALFYANAKPLAELSLKYRLPLLSGESGFAAVGGAH